MAITGIQIRMARAALGWKLSTLSDEADVSWARLQHIERADGVPIAKEEVLSQVKTVFEQNGIAFLAETETEGAGIRFTQPNNSE